MREIAENTPLSNETLAQSSVQIGIVTPNSPVTKRQDELAPTQNAPMNSKGPSYPTNDVHVSNTQYNIYTYVSMKYVKINE